MNTVSRSLSRRSVTAPAFSELLTRNVLVSLSVVAAFALMTVRAEPVTDTNVAAAARQPIAKAVHLKAKAPTTAAGYRQMFAQLPDEQWGGGDIALTLDMGARRVWWFGDTLSEDNGFVHSTVLTQDGGGMHVSRQGRQVLPDGPGDTYYWPEAVERRSHDTMRVVAREIRAGHGAWGFKPTGRSRAAVVRLTTSGDVAFVRWAGWTTSTDPGYTRIIGPNHYGYGVLEHEEISLAGGRHLVTESQNWDDALEDHQRPDGSLRYVDWQPLFSAKG